MAFLGLQDEAVPNRSVASFTDNQIGGVPHWLQDSSSVPMCPLCRVSPQQSYNRFLYQYSIPIFKLITLFS